MTHSSPKTPLCSGFESHSFSGQNQASLFPLPLTSTLLPSRGLPKLTTLALLISPRAGRAQRADGSLKGSLSSLQVFYLQTREEKSGANMTLAIEILCSYKQGY